MSRFCGKVLLFKFRIGFLLVFVSGYVGCGLCDLGFLFNFVSENFRGELMNCLLCNCNNSKF